MGWSGLKFGAASALHSSGKEAAHSELVPLLHPRLFSTQPVPFVQRRFALLNSCHSSLFGSRLQKWSRFLFADHSPNFINCDDAIDSGLSDLLPGSARPKDLQPCHFA